MIILRFNDVKNVLPMAEVIEVMKAAFAAFSGQKAEVPLRTHLNIPHQEGSCLFMPAYVMDAGNNALALKAVSVFPNNIKMGIPIIHAAVLVLDDETGRIIALLEGGSLTAIRTGAASGAATDLLAREDSHSVVIFGAGVQGRTQLEAVCAVRPINKAWVYDPDIDKAETFVRELSGVGRIPEDLRVTYDPAEAASSSDIICTATTSKTPVYPVEAIQPGTHINGVGSYTLEMVENPPELCEISSIFVDSIDAVLAESGEIAQAIRRNILDPENMVELGNLVRGLSKGRTSNQQITFFKSVGIAVQDAMAAHLAIKKASEKGLGQFIDL